MSNSETGLREKAANHSLRLKPGMYVRTPWDIDREDGEYRDYRIGQIANIDELGNKALIFFLVEELGDEPNNVPRAYSLDYIRRCLILPNTEFTHVDDGVKGEILICCNKEINLGEFLDYFVRYKGRITQLPENELIVTSTRQDPKPQEQMRSYELHHPKYRSLRNEIIECYSELESTTFGIEDLVGSRVHLLSHQAEAIVNVLNSPTPRFMLADEVGLGKTIEACVILKALRRREEKFRTLVFAPDSITQQWHNELDSKFWLDFLMTYGTQDVQTDSPGSIISFEELQRNPMLSQILARDEWGLLIVDEAHKLRKDSALYDQISDLSKTISRLLLLSATPIQQRRDEFLALLRLLDPIRYQEISESDFGTILEAQDAIRKKIAYLQPVMNDKDFQPDEFLEEIDDLKDTLEDPVLSDLINDFSTSDDKFRKLNKAREIVAYICENYRVESRMIRNRRVSIDIDLPTRILDESYCYEPTETEMEVLEELYDYVDEYLGVKGTGQIEIEFCRILLHAAASSPHALLGLLETRQNMLNSLQGDEPDLEFDESLTTYASPRHEQSRIHAIMETAPFYQNEPDFMERLHWKTSRWLKLTDEVLEAQSPYNLDPERSHRFIQVIKSLKDCQLANSNAKTLIFSFWPATIDAVIPILKSFFGLKSLATFHSNMSPEELEYEADKFQSDDECQILLCDELGGEGRNFQIAEEIIHIDLPWTPSQIEQRIGRVDRLGRRGEVTSILPYAIETIEHDLFRIWNDAFELFTKSMSGMEIALEEIQDNLLLGIGNSVRRGISEVIPQMTELAQNLKEVVEQERYFEEGSINQPFRRSFSKVREKYRDGSVIREPLLEWAKLAGLTFDYSPHEDIVTFTPKDFNYRSIENAKFHPPNMEEALRRSRKQHDLVIKGTFNRELAVVREDLVFFAPTDDPWSDAIAGNALEAERGRCCAIHRISSDINSSWEGFELLYSYQINPKPLFTEGYYPSHLFSGQGYLLSSTLRFLISSDGKILKRSDPIWNIIKRPFENAVDKHLGRRSDTAHGLSHLRDLYPKDAWEEIISLVLDTANNILKDELSITDELALEASLDFARKMDGLKASISWKANNSGETITSHEKESLSEFKVVSKSLVVGIRYPRINLESFCFWIVESANK